MNEHLDAMNPNTPKPRRRFSIQSSIQRFALEAVVLFAVYIGITTFQTRDLIDTNEPVPDFSLKTTQGHTVTHQDLLGKTTVLTFWAPWCTVCKLESGTLSSLHNDTLQDDTTQVITIVVGYEDLSSVEAFIQEHEATYPVLLGTRSTSKEFRVSSFPTTYIIGPKGKVETKLVGYTTGPSLRARLML